VQINVQDAHYYLVCDPCYPAFMRAQTNAAMEKLDEVNRDIMGTQPKPKSVM